MKIQELYKTAKSWTRYYDGQDNEGNHVSPRSKFAVKWCLGGAIKKCYPNKARADAIVKKINKELNAESTLSVTPIWLWNDNGCTTFKEVKALVKKLDI